MRKIIILLCGCIILTSCSDPGTVSDSVITTVANTGAASESSTDISDADTALASETVEVTVTSSESKESEPVADESDYEKIAEYNGITIKSKGLAFSDDGIAIIVLIDNQSDQDIVVQTRDFSVNDYICRAAFSPDIPAGKKKKAYILVLDDELQKNEIEREKIEDIEFKIQISTKDFESLYESDAIKWHFSH
jgi:ABC-type glycerol-3-phosphate transport system substrate-binding protein